MLQPGDVRRIKTYDSKPSFWSSSMSKYMGMVCKVECFSHTHPNKKTGNIYSIDIDNGGWNWREQDLEPLNSRGTISL